MDMSLVRGYILIDFEGGSSSRHTVHTSVSFLSGDILIDFEGGSLSSHLSIVGSHLQRQRLSVGSLAFRCRPGVHREGGVAMVVY